MRRWPRSFVVLAMAFASTVVITTGLVVLVVQDRGTSFDGASETPPPTVAADGIPIATGASLTVTGARNVTISLDQDSYDMSVDPDFERGFARVDFGGYELVGEDASISFGTNPLVVEQIDVDGLSFYPEPEDCTVTPGELNATTGVASAGLTCPTLEDIRDGGTIAIDGAVALPADLLGMRGDLPPSGGRFDLGDRTLEFSDGRMLVVNALIVETEREPLFLYGDDNVSSLGFERDPETAKLYLTYVVVDEEPFDIDDDACAVSVEDIGMANPITTVQELTIRCEPIDFGDHGVIAIDDTLVIDLIVPQDLLARR